MLDISTGELFIVIGLSIMGFVFLWAFLHKRGFHSQDFDTFAVGAGLSWIGFLIMGSLWGFPASGLFLISVLAAWDERIEERKRQDRKAKISLNKDLTPPPTDL